MRKIPQSFLFLAGCVAIAVITMVVFVQFLFTDTTSAQKERILLYDNAFSEKESVYAKISEYPPDKAWFFVYPSSVKFNATENTY
jgi:hypothetical protein